jgi:YD repeat-containing protein
MLGLPVVRWCCRVLGSGRWATVGALLSLVLVLLPPPNAGEGGMERIWSYTAVDAFCLPKSHTAGGVTTTWGYFGPNQVPLTKDVLEAEYKNRQGLKFEELDAKDIKHTIIETRPDQGGGEAVTVSRYWSDGRLDRVLNPDKSLTEYRYYGSANIADKAEVTPEVEGYLYQVAQTTEQDKDIGSDLSGLSADKLLVTTTTRDMFGRVTGTVSPGGATTMIEYDGLGLVKRQSSPPVVPETDTTLFEAAHELAMRPVQRVPDGGYNGRGLPTKMEDCQPSLEGKRQTTVPSAP